MTPPQLIQAVSVFPLLQTNLICLRTMGSETLFLEDQTVRLSLEEGFDSQAHNLGEPLDFDIEPINCNRQLQELSVEIPLNAENQSMEEEPAAGHKMIIRAKAGIFKPKQYPLGFQLLTVKCSLPTEPSTIEEAVKSKH